ncbi:MAG: hypothetical protein Q9208_008574 [Pyrenodesmia sp. 3 TL-2023]
MKLSHLCLVVQSMTELDVRELLERPRKQLRIIFAPLDFVDPDLPERTQGLQAIYKHFRVPTEFILERSQSVTHSFGSYMDAGQRSQTYGLMDPFGLLVIIAENLFLEISTAINKVLCVIRYTENLILRSAGGESTEEEFDFVGLHNISKHVIYLKESSSAAVALTKRFCEGHETIMKDITCPERLHLMRSVHELLQHKTTLLNSLVLRVAGMESLMQNLINLARKPRLQLPNSHLLH